MGRHDDPKPPHFDCRLSVLFVVIGKMLGVQASLVHGLENGFAALGRNVARHPFLYMLGSVVLTAALTASMVTLAQKEEDQQNLWLPANSEYISNANLINKLKPVYSVSQTVLIVAEDNLLTLENILAMIDLRDTIMTLSTGNATWNQLCTIEENNSKGINVMNNLINATFPEEVCDILGSLNNEIEENEGENSVICFENHILSLFVDIKRDELSQEKVLQVINSEWAKGITSFLLGGIERKNERVVGAKATVLSFSLDKIRSNALSSNSTKSYLSEMESKFINATLNHTWPENLKAFPSASRSAADLTGDDVQNDLGMMLYGYLLVTIYVMLALGRGLSCREMRAPLSLMGIVVVIMGFVSSNGFCALVGLKSSDMNSILPFLLLGIGIDDMFVIVQSYDNLARTGDKMLDTRMGEAMLHAGMAILITSLTDVLAFGIGSTTVLPALRSFCIYTAVAIFFVFVYMCTFFLPIFVLDQKRMENDRNAILCCITHNNEENKLESSKRGWLTTMFAIYASIISKLPIKIVLLLGTSILLAFSTYNLTLLETDFKVEWFLPQNSYLRDYLLYWEQHFPSNGVQGNVYVIDVDLNNAPGFVVDVIDMLADDMVEQGNLAENSANNAFMFDFANFVNDEKNANNDELFPRNMTLTKNEFDEFLSKFLWTTQKGLGNSRNLVVFDEEPECGTDRSPNIKMQIIPYTHQRFETSLESVSKMKSLQSSLAKLSASLPEDSRIFAHSGAYANLLTLDIITSELLRNILLALICVFLCTMLLIGHFFTSILVTTNVMMTLVHVTGFMHLWGLTIDTISALLITIAMGLSVDYSAHVAHAFGAQNSNLGRNDRMINALTEMGPAVLNGGFSTFLAFSLLATAKSFIFVTFFKVFFLVVFFGLLQGLLVLPIVLSLIGPGNDGGTNRRKNTIHVAKAVQEVNMENSWGEGGHVATSANAWATLTIVD